MTDSTSVSILPIAASSDAALAKTAVGAARGPSQQGKGANEGSFLDFLNAFNAISGDQNDVTDALQQGGSALPLTTQVADTGRLPLTPLSVATSQATGIEPGARNGAFATAALSAQSAGVSTDVYSQQAIPSVLTQTEASLHQGVTGTSTLVSDTTLASRLAVQVRAGVSTDETADAASLIQINNKAGSLAQPVPALDGAVASGPALAAPQNAAQLDPQIKQAGKVPSGRPGSVSAAQAGSSTTTLTALEASALSPQSSALELRESDALFTAQLKQLAVEQQSLMHADKSLLQSTVNTAATNTAALDAASSIRLAPTQSSLMTDAYVSTNYQATVSETFGKPDWNQGLARQMVLMANQNIRSAEIRLNPAHLGPIEVRIDMEDDQVNLAFSSRHAVVREAMEQAIPRLREMFEESGLNLADTDVSQHSFAEQRSQQAEDNSNHQAKNFANQSASVNAEDANAKQPEASVNLGLVDYYI